MINVFCSVISVVVAFGFFEVVNGLITGQIGLHPAYTEPACIVGLFLITFIVLRTLADTYLRGNVKLPAIVDFAGGGVCGLINAQFIGRHDRHWRDDAPTRRTGAGVLTLRACGTASLTRSTRS